jgi:hypothetical protein
MGSVKPPGRPLGRRPPAVIRRRTGAPRTRGEGLIAASLDPRLRRPQVFQRNRGCRGRLGLAAPPAGRPRLARPCWRRRVTGKPSVAQLTGFCAPAPPRWPPPRPRPLGGRAVSGEADEVGDGAQEVSRHVEAGGKDGAPEIRVDDLSNAVSVPKNPFSRPPSGRRRR